MPLLMRGALPYLGFWAFAVSAFTMALRIGRQRRLPALGECRRAWTIRQSSPVPHRTSVPPAPSRMRVQQQNRPKPSSRPTMFATWPVRCLRPSSASRLPALMPRALRAHRIATSKCPRAWQSLPTMQSPNRPGIRLSCPRCCLVSCWLPGFLRCAVAAQQLGGQRGTAMTPMHRTGAPQRGLRSSCQV